MAVHKLQTFILTATAACSLFLATCGEEDHRCFKLKEESLLLAVAAMVQLLGAIGTFCHAEKFVGTLRYQGTAIQVILGIVAVAPLAYMISKKEEVEIYIGEWMFAVYCFTVAVYANSMFVVLCTILFCRAIPDSTDCEKVTNRPDESA